MTSKQLQSIYDDLDLSANYFTWCMGTTKSDNKTIIDFVEVYIETELYGNNYEECVLALMEHTGMGWSDAYTAIEKDDYFVADDEDANKEAQDYAEGYLEDIVLPEIPNHLQQYFNTDDWISDYLDEGRGHILSHWDGTEQEEIINNTTYYIYRR